MEEYSWSGKGPVPPAKFHFLEPGWRHACSHPSSSSEQWWASCHLSQALIFAGSFSEQKEEFGYFLSWNRALDLVASQRTRSLMSFHPVTRGKHGMGLIFLNLRMMQRHTVSLHLCYLTYLCFLDLSICLLSRRAYMKIKKHMRSREKPQKRLSTERVIFPNPAASLAPCRFQFSKQKRTTRLPPPAYRSRKSNAQ